MARLAGKVAIVTGAARGQGAAEARRFVEEGARVLVADVLDDLGNELVGELGDAARYRHLDVSDEQQWQDALAFIESELGVPSVLVNNAGILRFQQIVDVDLADWHRILEVNLTGTFLGIKTVAPAMQRAGGGSIVNISSTAALTGVPAVGAYAASKWGVRGLTKVAAIELGSDNIRVNSVHPGSVDTPMMMFDGLTADDFAPYYNRLPIKRLGTVDDIAEMVLFLASDESTYCTGAEFVVDGGQTCGDLGFLG